MNCNMKHLAMTMLGVAMGLILAPAQADTLRNVNRGEPVPAYRLETMTGATVDSAEYADKVVVLVYVVARQRSSERAAADADAIVKALEDQPVELLFVTADSGRRDYFEQLWKEKSIEAPLAFDPERKLYADLGLIVFTTTVIIDRQGRLAHAIATRGTNYRQSLDGYIRHTLGLLDDAGLEQHLKARSFPRDTPRSLASRHRSAARLLRDKNLNAEAEGELLKALELDPQNIDARLDLADLCLRLDRIDEASRYIDEALAIDARRRRAKLLRGITLFRQNRLDEAEAILTEALVLNPDPARTHYYLGRINEARGDKDKAIEHYRQSLERLLDEPNANPRAMPLLFPS